MNQVTYVLIVVSLALCHSAQAAPRQCTIGDFAYGGSEILVSGMHNSKNSWEECQVSCQAITACTNWSWFSPDVDGTSQSYCTLHFSGSQGLPLPGVISGPRTC
ncbi:hypothetical protein TCAL_15328 [Tigriopus californicus]|uniref:Apple domain-containing protein n=1 Tax=Tigriopus californicus TaxID=6832 RepID=A0A553PM83_TIGCA|nr:uncharacterized protein LOC131890628 [Tigriopus californicus]TRY78794.1 hypothetical protein TCAL_15328 [Tigriopus californicus]